ncbi:MAG TPA: hypothetical protein VH092_24630 [Urbifossiella sp.]|jgi:hypothetical protein|nr:hypothetical protein [Urbifossiella sp.]
MTSTSNAYDLLWAAMNDAVRLKNEFVGADAYLVFAEAVDE